ncbi:hypothetical protein AX17_006484 [Amanita inopinata Kibby_2008]|nr:hypothetical protein AX17_006484 [Amanita inopinata Kibby_2008]
MSSAAEPQSLTPIQRHFAHIPEVLSFDPSTVKGNITDDEKRLALKLFRHFSGAGKKTAFVPWISETFTYKEMWVYGREGALQNGRIVGEVRAESMHEVVVTENMCNSFGILHGACASLILDMCSISPIVILGLALGIDTTGVSQSLNIIFHQPVRLGRVLKVKAHTISMKGRILTSRGEVRANHSHNLLSRQDSPATQRFGTETHSASHAFILS